MITLAKKLTEFIPVSGIYKITCIEHGRIYIGESKSVYTRIYEHVKTLIDGTHSNAELLKDFRLYGLDSFEWEILFECDKDDLRELEAKVIIEYHYKGYRFYNKLRFDIDGTPFIESKYK
jgi:group I intron endonuclease